MNFNQENLPRLPGYSFSDPRVPPKQIPQTLGYMHGVARIAGLADQSHPERPSTARMESDLFLQSQVRPLTARSQGSSRPGTASRQLTEPPQRIPAADAPAVAALETMHLGQGSQIPAWVAYDGDPVDGQVLTFGAYFIESAMDGRDRVRTCVIRLFLEDGTVDVCEPKPFPETTSSTRYARTDNSGIVQGRLLKRHKALGSDGAALTFRHLNVGRSVQLYGRTFSVIACDAFTRDFLTREGVDVLPDEEAPASLQDEGNTCALLGAIGMGARGIGGRPQSTSAFHPQPHAHAHAAAPATGGPAASVVRQMKKSDGSDRRVLRFFCSWDDRRSDGGELHRYTLNYYLADGTVEVLETLGRNSGRDPFPKMLSRSKLPTNGDFDVGSRPGEATGHPTVTHADLRVGGEVGVYGRALKLHDCDESTRLFYVKEMGRSIAEMAPCPLPEDVPKPPPPAPPHNGFGSDADSLRNCYSLVPRPPKHDFRHWEANDGKTLRFTAQFAEGTPGAVPPNDERRFVVTLYLVDNTVSVYEPPVRNSGIVGGKFLERTMEPARKPNSRAPYTARDFYVGNSLTIHSHCFTLLTTDPSTERTIADLALQ